ncbi:uncharacterized protein [Haliotis cracherodii]|uniref:uncharacterized protein n=1 Tax=Haliotis cracherodii TaxID=6455 RepID=UPI0039ECE280
MNALSRSDSHSIDIAETGLYRCIKSCDITSALLCIGQGEDAHVRCKLTGRTYLHFVILASRSMTEKQYVPFVYLLSNAEIDLDHRDNEGRTALQLSIKSNLLQMMVAVLKCGATADQDDEELIVKHAGYFVAEFRSYFRKFSPGLWQSVADNNRFRVNKLVKSWCRVNISKGKNSLIEFAKVSGADDSLIQLLIKNEASIEFAHATLAGDEERMKVLLCNGSVDLTTQDLSNRDNFFGPYTPLTLEAAAIKYGHRHVLHLISGQSSSSAPSETKDSPSSVVCTIV